MGISDISENIRFSCKHIFPILLYRSATGINLKGQEKVAE